MRKFAIAAALAIAGWAPSANAAVTVTLTSGLDFYTFNNSVAGDHSGVTSNDYGTITWSTGVDSFVTNTSIPGVALAPKGDGSMYLFATAGSDATISWGHDLYGFDIYWGSPDVYNTLTLSNGDAIGGAEILALAGSSSGLNSGSVWVHIVDTVAFSGFVASSTAPAFEFDLAAPEPSTWAMMTLGFAMLGYGAFRRSSKGRPAIA